MGNAESSSFYSALGAGAVAGGAALWALMRALSLRSQSNVHIQFDSSQVLAGERYSSSSSPVTATTTISRRNIYISQTEIKIMSYNVWSREDVEVEERMAAICNLVEEHSPDVIFFQEVTPYIYQLFHSSRWWQSYTSSVSREEAAKGKYFCLLLSKLRVIRFISMRFKNSSKGKGLVGAEIEIGSNKTLIAATSHLKCQNPPSPYNREKRVSQAKEALRILREFPNVIFGGDMNWDDDKDGAFPLERGWKDAWIELRGGEHGWTFDTKSNVMLQGNSPLQKRLDRFICKLEDYSMKNVEMIGKEPIPGILYCNNKGKLLPVLASDHYGLILTISVNV